MATSAHSCPSCGARVPAGADHCDLCGASVEFDDEPEDDAPRPETESSPASGAPSEPEPEASGGAPPDSVFCNQCGHQNPADANYCGQCGAELQDLTRSAAPEGTRAVSADLPSGAAPGSESESAEAEPATRDAEPAAMGRQIVWMVGIGVVLVLGFFFATQWSQEYEWGGEQTEQASPAAPGGGTAGGAPQTGPAAGSGGSAEAAPAQTSISDLRALVDELSGPVEGPVADKIDSLRAAEQQAQGERQRQLRTQLVRLYIGAGAPGQAALLQRQVADATGDVDDRRRAADLLYRWMRQVEQQSGRARVADVAQHVAAAYEAVADERSQDLDARTRMGEAYLLTNNPMKGIRAINNVLGEDSTFVPARFQKGLALLQINRLDQAIQQFRQVQEYADPQEPFYKQAERAIEVINEQRSSAAPNSGSP